MVGPATLCTLGTGRKGLDEAGHSEIRHLGGADPRPSPGGRERAEVGRPIDRSTFVRVSTRQQDGGFESESGRDFRIFRVLRKMSKGKTTWGKIGCRPAVFVLYQHELS